ncbi:MAG TPA: PDZ domain-containing protein [Nitrospirae bacterium]|nr:PDZ domain-containing protein [Nitrospirota bacterium]
MMTYMRFITALFFIAVIMSCNNLSASEIPLYELKVRVLPESNSIEGRVKVTVPEGMKLNLRTDGLNIKTFRINGREYEFGEGALKALESGKGERIVEIEYSAVFKPKGEEESGVAGSNVVDTTGVMLLQQWYPEIKGDFIYSLTVEVPKSFEAISEAEAAAISVENDIKTVSFDFPHPLAGITLVAGKYRVREEQFQGISIKTYLFSGDEGLADTYIENTKRYLKLYKSMLGAFPYKSFSIVENRYQTGYSFPTYTLLGSKVIRLPFIVRTSLGHEILHQWFGNYVYVDYKAGNWSEGLTTYLSDHWYKELSGEGAEYRKKIMVDYMNYVSADNEIALKDFISREGFSSRTIGYGKSAMVFHMLRKRLGDDAFFRGLREFIKSNKYREATWDDIRASLASSSGLELKEFFKQWIDRKGVPSFDVKDAMVVFRDGKYLLRLNIIQDGAPFVFDLPARVETAAGEEKFIIRVDKADQHYEKAFSARPLRIFLDGNYDTMRRLAESEVPPVVSAFTGRKGSVVIVPEDEKEVYKDAAAFFKAQGYTVKGEKEVTDKEIEENSILIMSVGNRIYRRLFADRPLPEGGFVVKVYKNPLNSGRVAVVFNAKDREEVKTAFRKIFRYGNYSLLVFDKGKNIFKKTADSGTGISVDLTLRLAAVETANTTGLDAVIRKIKDSRVIFVGEMHTAYEDHVVQYEIIRRLFRDGRKLVIGMEMFQRPFQKYLDQYIQGDITEGEFLRKTEYFKRWGFDYNLYRDILQYARANRIPVIALNIRKEIIKKVSENGIDSLSEDEYAEIPQDMDMTNQQYREYLRSVFSQHDNNRNFENFVQSQILWDETMAHTIAETLKENPDKQMVVLAGNGHIRYSWGIPDRVRRLTNERPTVILNYGGEGFDRGIADFVLFPKRIEPPEGARLMVFLKNIKKGVVIEKVMKGGVAEKAGLKEGDIITAVGNKAVSDISDIRIELLDRKPGDKVKIKVKRKRFLFGMKEMVLDVVF